MANKRTNPDFVNGVPELVILQLIAGCSMHGYQLVQELRAASPALAFGEGCVYPILHRLEREGLLKAQREEVGSRNRLVYHITAKGRKQLTDKVAAWNAIVQAIRQILHGGEHVGLEMA